MSKNTKPIIFSGIQPSGDLHLANYIGAISNWVRPRKGKQKMFCIVDLHALTVPQEPELLRRRTRENAAWYLAAGVDPDKDIVFVQSQNKDHAQLAWILDCVASVGQLNRMTQFKEKSSNKKDVVSMGLLNYPVLMAADILLYNTVEVPVGEDQKQHVELARDIAQRFNSRFGDVFTIPEPDIAKSGARIMSLQDPLRKMSKSDPSPKGIIYLHEDIDSITSKIKSAVTDSGSGIKAEENKPAITNLLVIYASCAETTVGELIEKYEGKGYGEFKTDLANVVVDCLTPVRKRFHEIMSDTNYLDAILAKGLDRARALSSVTITRVGEVLGLVPA